MSTFKLEHLAAVRVSGDDAEQFLQAQLSADVALLAAGESGYAAYCTPKGNVIALLRLTRQEKHFLVIVAAALRDTLIQELGKYVLRARVKLEPLAQAVTGTQLGNELRYTIGDDAAKTPAPPPDDLEAFRAAELENGIAWLSPQTSGAFLPQMLGFERLGAVSFRKGCFPGQEVIARVRYLGKVKQLPVVLKVEGGLEAEPGGAAELVGADGATGSAVVIDAARQAGHSVLFLVARNLAGAEVKAVLIDDRRLEVSENVQAWATM